MLEVNGINVPFIPIGDFDSSAAGNLEQTGDSFASIFNKELDKIKFSYHALKRLEERQIHLNDDEMQKINTAVDKAESKGAKDSLVMMNSTAFIVNVPNRTVVTAMPIGEGTENVFTNIDSVVFAA